jgi:TonB family protein
LAIAGLAPVMLSSAQPLVAAGGEQRVRPMITGYLARPAPRLPDRRWTSRGTIIATTASLHVLGLALIVLALPSIKSPTSETTAPLEVMRVVLPRLAFVSSEPAAQGGGGGGGGNRQNGPIRHGEAKGHDAYTLRVAKPVASTDKTPDTETPATGLALDARPLSSGLIDQVGLPIGGVSTGISTGPGSGGGVGTGSGTGIGPGRGPGLGAGYGGGVGGGSRQGAYRVGGAVTAPRLLSQVRPRYTSDALERKIQGSVWLDLIVTHDGRVDQIRVLQALDPGLDEEAIAALRQWRFLPGRIANTPVDVAITVAMDFTIR